MNLPVTIIGGYLGAGKTSLVNQLLRHSGRRIAVAVNEFGALPIDQDLIVGAEKDVLVLAGGCVCCSIGDDLMGGLKALAIREGIEHILVEASGVALPGSIARSLALAPQLSHEATLVVVDCETVRDHAADKYVGDTILRQLADADLVIANKMDLVSSDARAKLQDWLAAQAPRAEILFVERGQVAPDIALGSRDRSPYTCDEPVLAHETATLDSMSAELPDALDVSKLCAGLIEASLGLARAKGFARDGSGEWKSIQIVGRRAEITPVAASPAGAGRLVCIAHGRKLQRDKIARLIEAASGPGPSRDCCVGDC